MARQTLHIFGHSEADSSQYDSEVDYAQTRFFICDTRDDLPSNPGDMDFALTKEFGGFFVGNNGHWVRVNQRPE
jgi:hypothetical protein